MTLDLCHSIIDGRIDLNAFKRSRAELAWSPATVQQMPKGSGVGLGFNGMQSGSDVFVGLDLNGMQPMWFSGLEGRDYTCHQKHDFPVGWERSRKRTVKLWE